MSQAFIRDGTGNGHLARVDVGHRLHTRAVSATETQEAMRAGDAYNINTGDIALTTAGESAIMYFKNKEVRTLHLTAVAVGIGVLPSPTEIGKITLVRNPTAGTIVDNALAVAQNQNRDFGSAKTLDVDVYKGAEGYTLTNGDDIAQFYQTGNGRLFAPIDFNIPQGASLGIKIDINDSTGGSVYAALIGHLEHVL
jgi:hypothetical protein